MTDIKEFVKSVKNKEIDIVEHIHKVLDDAESINKEYNYFNTITRDLAIEQAKELKKNPKGKLAGVVVSVKDSICVKDVETTAGSRILKGYKPLFHATVIDRIIKEGGIIIGKTAQDEFGFGGFSTNVGLGFKIPKNPFDKERSTGGSSGGSAGITNKLDYAHLSLGESTGGSIVEPSSFCGVVGLCPTYGRVSRYGLIDYANSLDKIGPISQSVYGSALLLETIAGNDKKESTSIDAPVDNYTSFVNKECKDFKIGIIKEAFGEGIDESIQKPIWAMIKKLESKGIKYTEVSLPTPIKYGLSVYYLLGTSEASTNLMKYCGMRYGKHEALDGNFNEYFTKVRSMHLGKEAKRRIVLGTFARMAGYRDAYYLKAAKVRTMIINEYKKAFGKFDCLITPTAPIQPPKFSEIDKLSILQNYMIDILTVGPNLAGLPHINMNIGFENKLPVGMLLTGNHLDEKKLIQLGSFIEKRR
jgi:aspartyl-tRNA(Asn)/glutamyl-tRNA(Gln) amidotransferase subunit A